MEQEIKALSWKQPYASLMLHGKIETRTWNTKYRGLVLICASKKSYTESKILGISGEVQTQRILLKIHGEKMKESEGVAIAIGYLTDCRPMRPEDEQQCFVKYNPDLYCHVYTDVRAIEPFSWKGTQGWKTIDEETKQKIKFKG